MTELQKRLAAVEEKVQDNLLPGWGEQLGRDNIQDRKLKTTHELLVTAVNNDDEYAFERILGDWTQLWRQVNEAVAERYREEVKPEDWELRYIKWMKIKFIRMASPAGELYLVPRKPRVRPRAKHWYTVDEMIDMMSSPAIRAAISTFGALPARPEGEKLEVGDRELHLDFLEDEPRAQVLHRLTQKWTAGGNIVPFGKVLEVDRD